MGNAIYQLEGETFKRVRHMRHLNGSWIRARTPRPVTMLDYQRWASYPDSPVLTDDYPYQVICNTNIVPAEKCLICCSAKMYYYHVAGAHEAYLKAVLHTNHKYYLYVPASNSWSLMGSVDDDPDEIVGGWSAAVEVTLQFIEANNDIYADDTYTTVHFEQTTEIGDFEFVKRCNL